LILSLFSKCLCGVRLFGVLEKIQSGGYAGDKAAVAEMTKFPLSMGYEMEVVKTRRSSRAVMTKFLKAMPTLLNALEALNRKKNRRGGIMSIALSRRLQTTRKTHRSASFLS